MRSKLKVRVSDLTTNAMITSAVVWNFICKHLTNICIDKWKVIKNMTFQTCLVTHSFLNIVVYLELQNLQDMVIKGLQNEIKLRSFPAFTGIGCAFFTDLQEDVPQ